jgi:acetoin utilization deacetylase AcuC-like enzyme
MGFCLFNNIAIAAASAIAEHGVERVLIIDWDVHAGNGTAEIFRERSDVLFACIHEHGLYPGTGALHDVGAGAGEGYTINLPVPAGSREPLWLALLQEIVLPAARAFAPSLVLVSAGFDAHACDPLANCLLETGSFARMAALVRDAAGELGAPIGLVLEGGYDSAVLADCVCGLLPVLAGEAVPEPSPAAHADGLPRADARLVSLAATQTARHWPL